MGRQTGEKRRRSLPSVDPRPYALKPSPVENQQVMSMANGGHRLPRWSDFLAVAAHFPIGFMPWPEGAVVSEPGERVPVYDSVQAWVGTGVLMVLAAAIAVAFGITLYRRGGLRPRAWLRRRRHR